MRLPRHLRSHASCHHHTIPPHLPPYLLLPHALWLHILLGPPDFVYYCGAGQVLGSVLGFYARMRTLLPWHQHLLARLFLRQYILDYALPPCILQLLLAWITPAAPSRAHRTAFALTTSPDAVIAFFWDANRFYLQDHHTSFVPTDSHRRTHTHITPLATLRRASCAPTYHRLHIYNLRYKHSRIHSPGLRPCHFGQLPATALPTFYAVGPLQRALPPAPLLHIPPPRATTTFLTLPVLLQYLPDALGSTHAQRMPTVALGLLPRIHMDYTAMPRLPVTPCTLWAAGYLAATSAILPTISCLLYVHSTPPAVSSRFCHAGHCLTTHGTHTAAGQYAHTERWILRTPTRLCGSDYGLCFAPSLPAYLPRYNYPCCLPDTRYFHATALMDSPPCLTARVHHRACCPFHTCLPQDMHGTVILLHATWFTCL